jgi:AraC family transcriptional regulator of adaptative response / DNA-3-methyladenine glycosylase II
MPLDPDACWRALCSKDARFDGRFFVGVSSTGIYCRPICPARAVRREHCSFHPSAAAAEAAGYRPCLRCRPELAPGNASVDSVARLAADALGRIEGAALGSGRLDDVATELGITNRHLRRVVRSEFGVSPIELAQTHRLLVAKQLLTDTNMSVTEVAFASGFSSLRRYNDLFKRRYGLIPTSLRKARSSRSAQEPIVGHVAFRPPLDWASLLLFLQARAARGTEAFEDRAYFRTVALGPHRGWLKVTPSRTKATLRVELSAALAPVMVEVMGRVKRLFDLSAHPDAIASHLGAVASRHPGLRVPGAFDAFEVTVRAVLGQQISVRGATTIAGRLVAALGEPVEAPWPGLTHSFPTATRIAAVCDSDLVALGLTRARAATVVSLARQVAEGRVDLSIGGDVEAKMAKLRNLPGIGEWTASYVGMRVFGWPDAFPHTDLGIRRALGESRPSRVLDRVTPWRPWRAYAAMHLWKSLEASP